MHGIVAGGIGKHADAATLIEDAIAFRAWYICELLYGPISAAVRLSIALLLLKLRPSRTQKMMLQCCLVVVCTLTVVYFFLNLLQCSPPSYFWKQFEDPRTIGSCSSPHMVPIAAMVHSVIAALSDWFIASLSVCLLWNSFITRGKKITLMVLLSLGAL